MSKTNSKRVWDPPKLVLKWFLRLVFSPVYVLFSTCLCILFGTGILIHSIEEIKDKKWYWY